MSSLASCPFSYKDHAHPEKFWWKLVYNPETPGLGLYSNCHTLCSYDIWA